MNDLRIIINERFHGGNEYLEGYCMIIDDLIYESYSSRYRAYLRLPKSSGRETVEKIINRTKDYHVIDYVDFQNHCWDMLEGDDNNDMGLLGKIYYLITGWSEEADDRKVRRYILNMFTNELQQMIDQLNPGLRTRKKQIERILKRNCNVQSFQGRKLWQLKELENPSNIPATIEDIINAAYQFTPPSLSYSKPGSKRGPSIRDEEMSSYLQNILRSVGGAAYHHDLIEMIARVYSLSMDKQVDIAEDEGKTLDNYCQEASSVTKMLDIGESDTLILNCEHQQAAEAIVKDMSNRLRTLYACLFIQEKKQTEAAGVLKISNASISNYKKELEKILSLHLDQFSLEESIAVMHAVSDIILDIE